MKKLRSYVLCASACLAACRSGATPASTTTPPPTSEDAATIVQTNPDDASVAPVAPVSVAPTVDASAAATTPTPPDDMTFVPGGTFTMGSDDDGELDERPAHHVTVASFFLDKTEVSQTAYDECVTAKVCTAADPEILATFGTLEAPGPFKGPHKPVVGITWQSAREYCGWRKKRLPREAEFERAVRGDDSRRYPWGNDPPTKERTVFYPANFPEDVGTHPTGNGPYGNSDLAGNVWEWLEDDYDPVAYTRPTASEGKPGNCDEILAAQNKLRLEGKQGFTGTNPIPVECEKSIRGGAYNYSGPGLRSTNRVHHAARFKLRMLGFRCAADAK